jgi:predicted small metal-binding protein
MKTIACGDLVPGCDFKAEAESEDELLRKVAVHAREAHGINEVTPDLMNQVRSKIRDR